MKVFLYILAVIYVIGLLLLLVGLLRGKPAYGYTYIYAYKLSFKRKHTYILFYFLLPVILIVGILLTIRDLFIKPTPQPQLPPKPVIINSKPDTPHDFGRMNLWIAVPEKVSVNLSETLGLTEIAVCNWESGIDAAYACGESYIPENYVFITPPIRNWLLAVGHGLPNIDMPEQLPRWRALMKKLSHQFGEAYFFAAHRTVSYAAWAHYVNGQEMRLFACCDYNLLYNLGILFAEEKELDIHLFDLKGPEDPAKDYLERGDIEFPGEEDVLTLAGKRSINPSDLESLDLPPSVGLVGRLSQKPA